MRFHLCKGFLLNSHFAEIKCMSLFIRIVFSSKSMNICVHCVPLLISLLIKFVVPPIGTPGGTTNFISTCLKKSMSRSFNLGSGGKHKIIQSRLRGQAHQYQLMKADYKIRQLMKADYKIRQKRILEHESSYSKTGGHVLTVKFGNRQRRHRLRIIIGCSISESADGSY